MKYTEVKHLFQRIYEEDIFDKSICEMSYNDKVLKNWYHLKIVFNPLRFIKKSFSIQDYQLTRLTEMLGICQSYSIYIENEKLTIDID